MSYWREATMVPTRNPQKEKFIFHSSLRRASCLPAENCASLMHASILSLSQRFDDIELAPIHLFSHYNLTFILMLILPSPKLLGEIGLIVNHIYDIKYILRITILIG